MIHMSSATNQFIGLAALGLIGSVVYAVFGGCIADAIANLQAGMDLTALITA